MNDIKKGFIAMIAILLVTIILYFTRFGGEKFVFLTDFLAVIFSFFAVVMGIYAVKMYSLKSLQGKALFLIVLGIGIWFTAELIWLVFFTTAYIYVEILRFLGYIPLIAAFFSVSSLSDPDLRKQRKKWFYLFAIFLIFTIIYLNVVPVIFGSTSLLENILNNGYVVVDFVILFGVFLLLKTSIAFKKGSLSLGWLIVALAFIALFIFDVYFAFNFDYYNFGDLIEIFWLAPYIIISYGFFFHYWAMKDFLTSSFEETMKSDTIKLEKKSGTSIIITVIAVGILLIILYLIFYINVIPLFSKSNEPSDINGYDDFVMRYRDDVSVIFTKEVIDTLNNEYYKSDLEYLFCMLGERKENKIFVTELSNPKLFRQGKDIVISQVDPACQIENSVGSIHSHKGSCEPSKDDLFTWGEMKNPEPLINAIQCDGVFYTILMPGEHESLDFRSLRWKVTD